MPAVVVPGARQSGKSTLVEQLIGGDQLLSWHLVLEGIEQFHIETTEVLDVARNNGEPVHQGNGCNHGVFVERVGAAVHQLGPGAGLGGIRYLDAMIAKTRSNPPRQEKGKPPQRMAA